MPPGTVYVGRGSRWGNYAAFRHSVIKGQEAVRLFCDWFDEEASEAWKAEVKRELRGKDLACWCSLEQPCHADVLLKYSNAS